MDVAISDATSPAAWPPMPSATTNSGGATTRLSSLWSRTHPTSVRLPKVVMAPRRVCAVERYPCFSRAIRHASL